MSEFSLDAHRWYVVHCRHQQDRVCAEALGRKGFPVYLPMRQVIVKHARRQTVMMRPVFGRYLFVGLDAETPAFSEVRRTIGVEWLIQLAGSLRPLPVGPEIVAAIRLAEEAGAFDQLNRHDLKPALPRKGDLMTLREGPFAGFIAEVAKATSENRIEIVLKHAQLATRITTALAKLEKVA